MMVNVNVSDDQQPQFRSLSEFYIIIFLNKNKTSMARTMGPFRNSQNPSWLSGPRTDIPTEPCVNHMHVHGTNIIPVSSYNSIKLFDVSIFHI